MDKNTYSFHYETSGMVEGERVNGTHLSTTVEDGVTVYRVYDEMDGSDEPVFQITAPKDSVVTVLRE